MTVVGVDCCVNQSLPDWFLCSSWSRCISCRSQSRSSCAAPYRSGSRPCWNWSGRCTEGYLCRAGAAVSMVRGARAATTLGYKGRQKTLRPHPWRRSPPYAVGVTREPTGRYQGGRGSLERRGGCRRRATGARLQKDGAGGRGAIGRIKLYLVIPMQKNNVYGT